jgi:hypothetical protein
MNSEALRALIEELEEARKGGSESESEDFPDSEELAALRALDAEAVDYSSEWDDGDISLISDSDIEDVVWEGIVDCADDSTMRDLLNGESDSWLARWFTLDKDGLIEAVKDDEYARLEFGDDAYWIRT